MWTLGISRCWSNHSQTGSFKIIERLGGYQPAEQYNSKHGYHMHFPPSLPQWETAQHGHPSQLFRHVRDTGCCHMGFNNGSRTPFSFLMAMGVWKLRPYHSSLVFFYDFTFSTVCPCNVLAKLKGWRRLCFVPLLGNVWHFNQASL